MLELSWVKECQMRFSKFPKFEICKIFYLKMPENLYLKHLTLEIKGATTLSITKFSVTTLSIMRFGMAIN